MEAAYFGLLLAFFQAAFGFCIHGLRYAGAAAHLKEQQNRDFPHLLVFLNAEQIAYFEAVSRLDSLFIAEDASQFDFMGGERSGFVETGGPEPFVEADRGAGSHGYRYWPKVATSIMMR